MGGASRDDPRGGALADRFGQLRANATFVQAAVVAAHGAAGAAGFRATDVRFFFRLFTNWVEHDVLRPEQDLELTQVRRVLTRLAQTGWLRGAGSGARGERAARHVLTGAGLLGLIEALVDPRARRPFEEVLFVACFAASYRGAVAARVQGADKRAASELRARVLGALDPARVLRAGAAAQGAVLADLERRVAASAALAGRAAEARARGAGDDAVARELEALDPYQLHRVRPFRELIATLPDDLRAFELGPALALRGAALFEPLAAQARAQREILLALADRLAALR